MELQSRGVRIPVQCPDTAKPPVGVSERETGQAERKRKPRGWNQTVSHTTDVKDGRKRQREGRINTECVLIEKHAGAKKSKGDILEYSQLTRQQRGADPKESGSELLMQNSNY